MQIYAVLSEKQALSGFFLPAEKGFHRPGVRLLPGHQGIAEDSLLQQPCGSGDISRVRAQAGVLVVGFEQMAAFQPVRALDCLGKGVDYHVGADSSRDFVVAVETGPESGVLRCRKCGLAGSAEAYYGGGAAREGFEQGPDPEVVGIVGLDAAVFVYAQVRGPDPPALGAVPVGRIEGVGLEGRRR